MAQPLDRSQIVACYRAIFDRDPESEIVIENHLKSGASLESFLRAALQSPEFKARRLLEAPKSDHLARSSAPGDIDVSGRAKDMKSLLSHMKKVWTKYGVEDPYYSVLTNEIFRKSTIGDQEVAEFYANGIKEYEFITKILHHNGISLSSSSTVLDFGCGLGRVGAQFATRYKKYIGVDISAPHLAQAESHFRSIGLDNSDFILLEKFLVEPIVADLIFSVIVLQHNPPPVIGMLIKKMCQSLSPGGVILFQVPTGIIGYKFDLAHYLKNLPSEGVMEMHAFPQAEVYKIMRDCDCELVEVFEHDMIGPIGESTIFVAQKKSNRK